MSSTLIISDTHLCSPFSEKKCAKLIHLFESYDTIILNGDFWEGYWYEFDNFLSSPWNKLFTLLKKKKAIYIYGNHDRESYSDSRRERFCDQACWRYEKTIGTHRFIFEHGNRLALKFDEKFQLQRVSRLMFIPYTIFEFIVIKLFGLRYFNRQFGKLNLLIKRQIKKELLPNDIFVCGHTHVHEDGIADQFINTGVCKYGFCEYATIDDEGTVKLHSEKY